MSSGPKVVKRYANRKLYDTERSCYVTLDDIATMIKTGEEVRVIDNKSGEDLTTVTLAQIIFEAEKRKGFMPIGLLRDLIKDSGDTITEFARDRVDAVQKSAKSLAEQAQRLKGEVAGGIERVIKKHPGLDAEASDESRRQHRLLKEISEVVDASQRVFEEVQKSLETRIKGGVDTVSSNLSSAVGEMRKRLETLEKRLDRPDS